MKKTSVQSLIGLAGASTLVREVKGLLMSY